MKVNIQAVNFTAQEALIEYAESKLAKLNQLYDKLIAVHVFLKVDNASEKENKVVEVKLEIPGDDIVVTKTGQSFEECIDLSVDTLKKLIIRKKRKSTSLLKKEKKV